VRLIALALLFAAISGCAEPGVVRVVDGRPELGRFISERAYALYGRGAEAEAAGDLDRAEAAFLLASEQDPESPEIWTRLGAIQCARAPSGPESAQSFARALAIDPAFAPALRERARCAGRRGDGAAALADAERALLLDPDDLDTGLVHAEALARAGKAVEAARAARALAARHPRSAEARRLAEGNAPPEAPLALVDAAILAGDPALAQRRALAARITGAELAVRAAALGRAAMARDLAAVALAADPTDASARIALAAAADLRGDLAALADAMARVPKRTTAPSPLARLLFAEILARRVGADAARTWLGTAPEPPAHGDPLLLATHQRVRGVLPPP
jgi:tetratricopeptide (TPR) repeat protein